MFKEEYQAAANAAKGKVKLMENNIAGYFVLSMMAGAFIGFGVLLTNSIGAQLQGAPYTKVILGCTFAMALSLVVMAGAELFTGNNMVMAAGMLKGEITAAQGIKLWVICWIGNLAGGALTALIYHLTELGQGPVGEFMAAATIAKTTAGPMALIARGILCNMLVCLAVWCGFKLKTESGKLIMIFWCILAFITTGFEHSVANMILFAEALINPCGQAVTAGGCLYNLILVTIGNIIGGAFLVALPYAISAKE